MDQDGLRQIEMDKKIKKIDKSRPRQSEKEQDRQGKREDSF